MMEGMAYRRSRFASLSVPRERGVTADFMWCKGTKYFANGAATTSFSAPVGTGQARFWPFRSGGRRPQKSLLAASFCARMIKNVYICAVNQSVRMIIESTTDI